MQKLDWKRQDFIPSTRIRFSYQSHFSCLQHVWSEHIRSVISSVGDILMVKILSEVRKNLSPPGPSPKPNLPSCCSRKRIIKSSTTNSNPEATAELPHTTARPHGQPVTEEKKRKGKYFRENGNCLWHVTCQEDMHCCMTSLSFCWHFSRAWIDAAFPKFSSQVSFIFHDTFELLFLSTCVLSVYHSLSAVFVLESALTWWPTSLAAHPFRALVVVSDDLSESTDTIMNCLPIECLLEIFSKLDSFSLRQCALVSATWRDLARQNIL